MTPKEKAEELLKIFSLGGWPKENALSAVDEILNNFGLFSEGKKHYCSYNTIEYYEQVKIEIENI